MARKDRNKKNHALNQKEHPGRVLSKRGWKVVGIGVGLVVLGYIILTLTDPRGQNWASTLSPLLLIGGYATIAVGIVTPDPS